MLVSHISKSVSDASFANYTTVYSSTSFDGSSVLNVYVCLVSNRQVACLSVRTIHFSFHGSKY